MSFDDKNNKVNNSSPQRSFFSPEELNESAREFDSKLRTGGRKKADYSKEGYPIISDSVYDEIRPKRNIHRSEDAGYEQKDSLHLRQAPKGAGSSKKAASLRNGGADKNPEGKEPAVKRNYVPMGRAVYIPQENIPKAANEFTRSAVINDTPKVKKRAVKLERMGYDESFEESTDGTVSVLSDDPAPVETYKQAAAQESERFSAKGALSRAADFFRHDKDNIEDRDIEMYDTENYKRGTKPKGKKKPARRAGPVEKIVRLAVLVLVIVLCIIAYTTARKVCNDQPMNSSNTAKVQITITADSTDSSVGEFLVKNNVVESKFVYKLRAILFEANYKEGTYEVSPSYTTEKIIDILSGYSTNN